jgi:hypothetical protein
MNDLRVPELAQGIPKTFRSGTDGRRMVLTQASFSSKLPDGEAPVSVSGKLLVVRSKGFSVLTLTPTLPYSARIIRAQVSSVTSPLIH